MIVSVINCSTSVFAGFVIFSVLGFMAHVSGKAVKDVATSGPGLAFVVYPEGIAQMPISPFWAVLFFFMLLTLGLDTQFAMFEAVVTGLVDEYPRFLKKRKELFIAFLCFLCFLLGIPMVMQVLWFLKHRGQSPPYCFYKDTHAQCLTALSVFNFFKSFIHVGNRF